MQHVVLVRTENI